MNIPISNLKLLLENFSDYNGFLLHGQNFGLASKICDELLKKKSQDSVIKKIFEVDIQDNPEVIRNEFLEPNLFGGNKTLVFYYPDAKSKKEILTYASYIKDKISVIILDTYSKQTDTTRKHFEQLKNLASVICHPSSILETRQRIKKAFMDNAVSFSEESIDEIANMSNGDVKILDFELQKIVIYAKYKEMKIDKDVVSNFLCSFNETDYASVTKSYFDRSVINFKKTLQELILQGESIVSIIYSLQRYAAKLRNVSFHVKNKISLQDAMKKEMVFFNEVNDFKKYLSSLKLQDVLKLEEQLFDIEIKTMQLGQDVGYNLLIKSLFNDVKN